MAALPNTALATTITKSGSIYTYFQTGSGELVEVEGSIESTTKAYESSGNWSGIGTTAHGKHGRAPHWPSRVFTPLAAAVMTDFSTKEERRYLFYVDDDNILCDVYFNTSWHAGALHDKKIQCASYSKLAAIRLSNTAADFICLYYQTKSNPSSAVSPAIELVSLSHMGWSSGNPPLNDPPLLGTSFSVVLPEKGILSNSSTSDKFPVVFFQHDTLGLGSSQAQSKDDYVYYDVPTKARFPSPHTGLACVDNGTDLYAFYNSDDNKIQWVRVDSASKLTELGPVNVQYTPVPGTSLAAVMTKVDGRETIVLFYLLHYTSTENTQVVNPYATTFFKTSTASTAAWNISKQESLVE